MSGPIVRKYGFPNFEKIFGERPVQHGVEDEAGARESPKPEPAANSARQEESKTQETEKTSD